MAYVAPEQAKPGMTLAAQVRDQRGRLLIPAGSVLTERQVASLKGWGVGHIEIEGAESAPRAPVDFDPALVKRVEREVAERLSESSPHHPFIVALSEYAVRRRLEATAGELVRS